MSSALDSQREREVQRYLQSWQVAQGSSLTVAQNISSIGAPTDHADFTPKASSDKALTAFAQLAVLRLNVKRAMVSLIDQTSQTILAEATRNLRLGTHDPAGPDKDNELWLGTAVLSRPDAICEHCLTNTCTGRDPNGRSYTAPGLVVTDCRLDGRFHTRPYVVAEPGVRFYAGVPIISRHGHKIGAYAVSDDKPRDGLTVDEVQFMQGIAQAIMDHLEWARDRVDRFKGERIVRGLAAFIETSYIQGGDSENGREGQPSRPPEMSQGGRRRPMSRASSYQRADELVNGTVPPSQQQQRQAPAAAAAASLPPSSGTQKTPQQKSDDMSHMLHRASELLRTSTLADGVVLFGATATNAKQLSRALRSGALQSTGGDDDDLSLPVTSGSEGVGFDSSDSDTLPTSRPCKLLAYSLADERARAAIDQGSALSVGTLEKYFTLFPKGKAFSFTAEGAGVSSEDDSASDREPQIHNMRRKVRMDHKELLKKIPGAKAVIFVPLYDYTEDRLAGGCFLWTSVSGRLMNLDDDLSYLRAFANSIMSQVARINTQKNEAAKTTFIASMSHELRSPLHGILGAAEFFRDTQLSSYQSGLIGSITTCGKTLLDTLNHVLDYSKINRLGRMQLRRNAKQNKLLKLSTDSLDSLNITAAVDLAVLVEEVVDATSAGHTFNRAPDAGPVPGLVGHQSLLHGDGSPGTEPAGSSAVVLLDICPRTSWMVRTQPGAIRRIIMNLFGNALKYTTQGSVHVSLRGKQSPDGSKVDVLLKVVDTGKGMSDEFQRNRLFLPFSQEDSFQPGTGLGLSIVKQIVDSLGGTLEVHSEQHKGTEITVRLRLLPVAEDPSVAQDDVIQSVLKRVRGRQLTLLTGRPDSPRTQQQLEQADQVLAKTCSSWFGMKVVKDGEAGASEADFYLYSEPPSLELLEQRLQKSGLEPKVDKKVPFILVCQNAKEAIQISQNQTKLLTSMSEIVEVIPQPCGPRKLAKVFAQCLLMADAKSSVDMEQEKDAHPQPVIEQPPTETPKDDAPVPEAQPAQAVDGSDPRADQPPSSGLFGLASPPPLNPGTPALGDGTASSYPIPKTNEPGPTDKAPPRHVLIVDDNKINLQLLVMFMKKCGFSYAEAENGQEALDRFTEACIPASQTTGPGRRRFDYVLMDISMPVMDGLEATKRIREFERENSLPQTNIIALTGLASADAQRDAESAGVDVFMPKPVRFAELKKLVNPS
ncbi:hsp90-like protein [Emericellopsis atlantica]|uniref:histidine kinase n=1 Tax=Emericellopsis atlantica TaxID=2614577 RepID=A0A9P7ZGB0_9HYPO|nr:hsp90-like protein [Emericellopsis atlantica]KAG9251287.1 hsp90-like protein [Emericellopsis atlantica]